MKSAFFICLLITTSYIAYGQYEVKSPAPKCNLPECIEETMDSTIIPNTFRGIGQEKNATVKTNTVSQKMYHIESLNALFFVPEAFVPLESAFNIGGAIKHITKVQIFHLETTELIFQTTIPENAWNGKWKNEPEYGFFRYVISIRIDNQTIEKIEGIVETKNPL